MAIQVDAGIAESDLVWTVGGLCQLNRIPFDSALLLQKLPAPHSLRQLIEALRAFGFRTGEGKIARAAYPCIGFLADSRKPALLIKRDAERLLYFEAGSQAPQSVPLELLKETFAADVLLLRHESATDLASEDGTAVRARFGFRWSWSDWMDRR